jgi:hypothetical protein
MKRVSEIFVFTYCFFLISLFVGVTLFLTHGFINEIGRVTDKVSYCLMIIPAACFFAGAAGFIYGIPGIVAAIICAVCVSTKNGKAPELATLGASLVAFFIFKAFVAVGTILNGPASNPRLGDMGINLATLGFGASGFILSLAIQTLLKNRESSDVCPSEPMTKGLKIRFCLMAVIFLTWVACYFVNPI